MATLTTHAAVAVMFTIPALRSPRLREALPGLLLPLSVCLLATVCDLDTGGRRLLGIPTQSVFSHRALFHSPFFAIVCSAGLAALTARMRGRDLFAPLWLMWGAAMLSHPLLDALTDGGRGLMLLLPFSKARLFFPWHPIHTPPAGTLPLGWRALVVRASELPFWLAAAGIGMAGLLLRRQPRFEKA